MAWINVFDAGPCSVDVLAIDFYGELVVLNRGEWPNFNVLDVRVLSNGMIEVETYGEVSGLFFMVRPEFDHGGAKVRIRDVESEQAGSYGPEYALTLPDQDNDRKVYLIGDGGVPERYIPDPSSFDPGPWIRAGISLPVAV